MTAYHPDRLVYIVRCFRDTIGTIHETTSLLKSSNGNGHLMDEYHKFISALGELTATIQSLHVDQLLKESSSFERNVESLNECVKKKFKKLTFNFL